MGRNHRINAMQGDVARLGMQRVLVLLVGGGQCGCGSAANARANSYVLIYLC